jgi:hypothetical protein
MADAGAGAAGVDEPSVRIVIGEQQGPVSTPERRCISGPE